ncbi:MAG: hypothetical protein EOP52_13970 [Sphingobacteriales bacterium]|nr:MAG: hypothetical protein EOP52_13970 [Sphingobacteriales bacterium]
MKAAYDYYPFGMVMPSRMLEDQSINCIPVSRTRYVREVVKQNQFSAGGVQSITGRAVAIGGSKLDQMDDSRLEVVRGEGQADEMPIEVALPVGTLLGADEVGVRLTTLVEGQGEIVAQLRWYPGGWSGESGPVGEDYEVLNEAMIPDGGMLSVEAGNEDAPLPVQMRSNGGLALVLRSVNSGSGRLVAAEVAYETVIRAVQTYVVLSCDTDGVWGGGYQYGFNGKKKDNEISGSGNNLDFGARSYDSRLGQWWTTDKSPKPNLSSYQFGRRNPLTFIDPDGNTEYYFGGKWVGSDGVKNNLIGLVNSKGVKKAMEKGTYQFPKEIEHGFSNADLYAIDANVLKVAKQISDLSVGEKGKNREFSTAMNKGEAGYEMDKGGIIEGKPGAANEVVESIHPPGEINIHSHPTGSALIDGSPYSSDGKPSPKDKEHIDKGGMFIIVGKEERAGAVRGQRMDGTFDEPRIMSGSQGRDLIRIYNNATSTSPAQVIESEEAGKILKDNATK